jgi:dynein heavy chain
MKNVKSLHKSTRWCGAYKELDKTCKSFLTTVPLIGSLGGEGMRPRHWAELQEATGKTFTPPYADENMELNTVLALKMDEFAGEVEEITDKSVKEMKMENTLEALEYRWSTMEFNCDFYRTTDVPLLKIGDEDFETLEGDQLIVQGMCASRYVKKMLLLLLLLVLRPLSCRTPTTILLLYYY